MMCKNMNMTLDALMKEADKQCKGIRNGRHSPGDVMVNALKEDGLMGISIRKSPRNYSLRGKGYILPIYIDSSKRIYIVTSNEQKGFKISPGKNTVGGIQFKNSTLYTVMKEGNYKKTYGWRWDPDCSRPYVLLEDE